MFCVGQSAKIIQLQPHTKLFRAPSSLDSLSLIHFFTLILFICCSIFLSFMFVFFRSCFEKYLLFLVLMLSTPQAALPQPLSLGPAELPQDCPPLFDPQEEVPVLNSFVKYWNVLADKQNIPEARCVSLNWVFHKEQSFLKESPVPYISLIRVSWFSGQRTLQCTRQDMLRPAWSFELLSCLQLSSWQEGQPQLLSLGILFSIS